MYMSMHVCINTTESCSRGVAGGGGHDKVKLDYIHVYIYVYANISRRTKGPLSPRAPGPPCKNLILVVLVDPEGPRAYVPSYHC